MQRLPTIKKGFSLAPKGIWIHFPDACKEWTKIAGLKEALLTFQGKNTFKKKLNKKIKNNKPSKKTTLKDQKTHNATHKVLAPVLRPNGACALIVPKCLSSLRRSSKKKKKTRLEGLDRLDRLVTFLKRKKKYNPLYIRDLLVRPKKSFDKITQSLQPQAVSFYAWAT